MHMECVHVRPSLDEHGRTWKPSLDAHEVVYKTNRVHTTALWYTPMSRIDYCF